jgi:hypothetical protein
MICSLRIGSVEINRLELRDGPSLARIQNGDDAVVTAMVFLIVQRHAGLRIASGIPIGFAN